MPTYEPDDIICLDGWCNAEKVVKQEGISTWVVPKNTKHRQCCSTCPDGTNCPARCKAYGKPCDSMEEYKNTEHEHGEYWRKDNIKSRFYKPDDGTRWWGIYRVKIFDTAIRIVSETFNSEESAKTWLDNAKNKEVRTSHIIKGKFIGEN